MRQLLYPVCCHPLRHVQVRSSGFAPSMKSTAADTQHHHLRVLLRSVPRPLFETCERFCTEGSKEDQLNSCKLCKCKACRTCSAICESGIPGDTKSVGCSTACDPDQAEAFGDVLRGCPFCNEDGSVAQLAPGALDGQSCIPANDKDISNKCYSHCSESNKASHCRLANARPVASATA